MIKKVSEFLFTLGTKPHYSPKRNQIARLINKVGLVYIVVVIPNILLTWYFGSVAATVDQAAGVSAMSLTIYLNHRGHLDLAKALTLIIGNYHIFSMALILGMEGAAHYYFPAALFAPLFFYSPKEIRAIISFVSLTVILTLLAHPLAPYLDPYFYRPELLINIFFYSCIIGSQFVIFTFVLHFYNESNRFEKSLEAVNNKLKKLSETDSLTELPNKRSFKKNIDREWGKSIRTRNPLSVIMMDVDYFKLYNDNYGHMEGDRCLKTIAAVINNTIRNYIDFPGRYGGEEFIILMTNTDINGAQEVAERIRKEVYKLKIPHGFNPQEDYVTCSFGISSCIPEESSHHDDLIQNADQALYKAKDKGRNRVEFFSAKSIRPA